MSKEARFNLIFLVALLLLSLPGVVMLISKQLKPGARRLADPPYVRKSESYNNPLPASSSSIRVVPPITMQWIEQLALERLGHRPMRHEAAGGRIEPIMSQQRRFEVLGVSREGDTTTVVLLGWLAALGRGEVRELEAEAPALGRLESVEVERLEVPPQVLEELKGLGFVVPPAQVGLTWLRFAPPPAAGDDLLRIVWRSSDGRGEDVLSLRRVLPVMGGGDKQISEKQAIKEGVSQ